MIKKVIFIVVGVVFLILILIGFLLIIANIHSDRNQLTCRELNLEGLCMDITIGIESKSFLSYLRPHNFPNLIAQHDELSISRFVVTNLGLNKTNSSNYNINFIPVTSNQEYQKTEYGSVNYGEYRFNIPPLDPNSRLEYVRSSGFEYTAYLNGVVNENLSMHHWIITIYRGGDWKIEEDIEGENGFSSIINGNWDNEVFYSFSQSEMDNKITSLLALITSLLALIATVIIGFSSIKTQRDLYKNQLRQSDDQHLKKQIELLKSLLIELDMISSKSNKIKVISKDYKIEGNLQWFKELLEKGNVPLHDMWDLDASKYLTELDNNIKEIELSEIKKVIVLINQKISLLNLYRRALVLKNNKVITDSSKKIIKEVIEIISDTKRFIEKVIKNEKVIS